METSLPVVIGNDGLARLIDYCRANELARLALVADQNTYAALGKRLERLLRDHDFDVQTVILSGPDVIPDERHIVRVLLEVGAVERAYLAVGSGTLTDIVRFASHRSRTRFISVPTAPSVDGFASSTSSLIINGFKQTIAGQPPAAIFGDIDTLCAAPRPMIAAGFGDMLGKYTSLADWRLGHVLWDEPYSESIAQRTRAALETCVAHAQDIGSGCGEGLQSLLEGLVESGLCMLDFGGSRPAGGSEHYVSHFLEMKLLREQRPAILHGAKVGAAAVMVAGLYEKVRQFSRQDAAERLQASQMPDSAATEQRIREIYPDIADQVIAAQAPYLTMTEQEYEKLKQRILDRWPIVSEIAASVPPSATLARLLEQAGGIVDPTRLGLHSEEVQLAMEHSHLLRDRFTVFKLGRMLGIA